MSMRMKRAEMGTDLVFWDWFVRPELWVGRHLSPTHLGGNETNNVLGRTKQFK